MSDNELTQPTNVLNSPLSGKGVASSADVRGQGWAYFNPPLHPYPPTGTCLLRDHGDVLLVEDEAIVSVVLARFLEGAGYRVHLARNGQDALQALKDGAQGVRTVITDVRMDGMNGLELAQELIRRYPEIRVLFVAGHPWDGEELLPGPLLLKPFTAQQLSDAIAQLLASGPPGQSLTAEPRKRK
jgi:CheY-like chemotaxis protein